MRSKILIYSDGIPFVSKLSTQEVPEPMQRLEAFAPSMKKKGRIQVGTDAAITSFDAEKIIDKAIYTQPAQYSAGIEYMMVNATLVLDKGEIVQGVPPGQATKAN